MNYCLELREIEILNRFVNRDESEIIRGHVHLLR